LLRRDTEEFAGQIAFQDELAYHGTNRKEIPGECALFTFASRDEMAVVCFGKGLKLSATKQGSACKREDKREAVDVQCGDVGQEFEKGKVKTYL
jgi:hypothetical protein